MSRSEAELRALLEESRGLPPGAERTALLEEIVRHADLDAAPELAVSARLSLAAIYCADGRWAAVFTMFDECLGVHDRRPWHFTRLEEAGLLHWYTFVVDSMVDFHDVPLTRIETALDDVERRLRAGDRDLRALYAVRRRLAHFAADRSAEEYAYERWLAVGGPRPGSVDDIEAQVERLVLRGDRAALAAAYDLVASVLNGAVPVDGSAVPLACLMLLPIARTGRHQLAADLHRYVRVAMARGEHRYEHLALRMEFCALTGNAEAAFDLLALLDGFETFERPVGRLWFATAVTVLTGAFIRAGQAETPIDLGDGAGTPIWQLHDRMRDVALDLAGRFDARNGSTACGDRVRARLNAEPVADFLPLRPAGRPPVDIRPPAGLSDAQLLDRARWHDHRCEPDEARACLAAVREAAGPLAAHLVELRAMFHQGPDTVDALRWAADRHREHGEETRALLAECWLGLCDPSAEGPALTAAAAAALRAGTDDRAAAWGEHWLAYALARLGRHEEAYAALRRGAARAAADPLVAGTLVGLEASWRNAASEDPTLVKELAATAVERFVAADAGRKAVAAVDELELAHERAGTSTAFTAYVERSLAELPADAPAEFRGHLRYARARARIAAGFAAEVVDDLYDAIGQAGAHRLDTTGPEYHLVIACHAAGRFVEALDAGLVVVDRLDGLRDAGRLADPDRADDCRLLLADCYRRIDEPWAALGEYERLIETLDARGATADDRYAVARAAAAELRQRLGPVGTTP